MAASAEKDTEGVAVQLTGEGGLAPEETTEAPKEDAEDGWSAYFVGFVSLISPCRHHIE